MWLSIHHQTPSCHRRIPHHQPFRRLRTSLRQAAREQTIHVGYVHTCMCAHVCMHGLCTVCSECKSHMHISIYTFSEDVYGHQTSYCLRSRKGPTDNARTKKYRCRSRCRCRCRCRSVPIDRFERSVRFKFSRFDSNFSWNPVGLIQIFPGTRKW